MTRRQWRSLGQAVLLLTLWAGLISAATVGSVRLDERYRAARFHPAAADLCPLAVAGSIVTPMCSAGPGW